MPALNLDQWQQVSPYLDQALSLSDEERVIWLESFRAQKPGLTDLMEQLLEEHRTLTQEHFLEHNPSRPAHEGSAAGQIIGAYTLISPIGEGGMGTVWLAKRSDGRFERQAAVKFLHFALAGKGTAERFQREGRILGQLAHPHIAELIDAGVTQSGEPYLVLEYVEGEHIDEYCDQRTLAVETRIKLFLDVLNAVAHAHANLIIHRDIKPSNVLVRKDGQAKLLDFGIAKLLGDDEAGGLSSRLTLENGGALTLQFAAPEQLTGEAITTASDVYSLGVLLYILLTGQHPAGPGPRSPVDLVKAIVETEPPRLVDCFTSNCAGKRAQERAATPERLRRQLRGDLETIVGKALKKNPLERYTSVTAFGDDLRRYLKHEPISARPDTAGYRLAKFVRRNRTVVVLAAVAFLAAVAGVAGTLIQARTASTQRDFALRQLSRAEAINDLNRYVLSNAAPSGKPFTVDDLLAGAEGIVRRQHGDQTIRSELLMSLGQQYTVQDEYRKAKDLLEEAYWLSRRVPWPATRAQASCSLAAALSRTGDLIHAETLFHQGFNEVPDDSLFVVERVYCLLRGSEIAENGGHLQEALTRAQAAQHLIARSSFRSDSQQLDALIVLAGAYNHAGQRREANAAFGKAATQLEMLGRDQTQMAGILFNNWGTMLIRAGRPLDAERALRHTIEISQDGQTQDSISPNTLANYGMVLYQLKRLNEAADYAERAYKKAKNAGDTMAVSQVLFHRARIYRSQGNLARARQMLDEVETELRGNLPAGHLAFAVLALERALNAQANGDLAQAMSSANQSVNMMETLRQKGRSPADYFGKALVRRSEIALQAGRTGEALQDTSRALPILQEAALPDSSSADVGYAYLALGRALRAAGRNDEAGVSFRSAAGHLEGALGTDHPDARIARQLTTVSALAGK
jgi:serine/threonine-protein kinase